MVLFKLGVACMSIGLANFQTPYIPNTVLLNAAGNSSHSKTLYPGCYNFYTQGAGGGGGNYAYPYGNGNGAGSGAGFNGVLRVVKKLPTSITIGNGGSSAADGVATLISGVMHLGAGKAGPTTSGGTIDPSGNPGTITIDSNNLNNMFFIKSATVNRNGNYGSRAIGGNSVLTNSGAGQDGGGAATARGAGGGGTSRIGGVGGIGGKGECKITFISNY